MNTALAATLLACIFSAAVSLIINFVLPTPVSHWWWSLTFFTIISITLKFVYNLKTDFKSYTELLLGTIAGKLLLAMLAVLVYALVDKKGLFSFSMHFMAHYILFTVFEIRYLLRLIKSKIP